jgi:alpha-ketoglutarate-dependent taurine dioxygenase
MPLSTAAENIEGVRDDAFRLRELTPSIGAEITGIDVGSGLDEPTFVAIRDAIHRYSVIVLRDQNLRPATQLALLRRLGPTRSEPYRRFFVPEAPQLMVLSNMYENGEPIGAMDVGGLWHTDMRSMFRFATARRSATRCSPMWRRPMTRYPLRPNAASMDCARCTTSPARSSASAKRACSIASC